MVHLLKRQPLISFIVPAFNNARYLEECISSILTQDVSRIEIICVDDASNDGTADLLSLYRRDPRVVTVRNRRNIGAGASRNIGLRLASARFIRFVDADDTLPYDSSSRLLAAAERFGTPLVRGNIASFRERPDNEPTAILRPVEDIGPINFSDHDSLRIPWYFTAYLIRRADVITTSARFPTIRRGEDPVFLARLLSRCPRVATISNIVYYYRSRRGRKLKYSLKDVDDYISHAYLVRSSFLERSYEACWLAYKPIFLRSLEQLMIRAKLDPDAEQMQRERLRLLS